MEALEIEVAQVKEQFENLRQQLEDFRRQFQ